MITDAAGTPGAAPMIQGSATVHFSPSIFTPLIPVVEYVPASSRQLSPALTSALMHLSSVLRGSACELPVCESLAEARVELTKYVVPDAATDRSSKVAASVLRAMQLRAAQGIIR